MRGSCPAAALRRGSRRRDAAGGRRSRWAGSGVQGRHSHATGQAIGSSVRRPLRRRRRARPGCAASPFTVPLDRKDYILETIGCGAAVVDVDGDGWLDVLVLSGSRLDDPPKDATSRLYRNNRNGTFTDITAAPGSCVPAGRRRQRWPTTMRMVTKTCSSPTGGRTPCIATRGAAGSRT